MAKKVSPLIRAVRRGIKTVVGIQLTTMGKKTMGEMQDPARKTYTEQLQIEGDYQPVEHLEKPQKGVLGKSGGGRPYSKKEIENSYIKNLKNHPGRR